MFHFAESQGNTRSLDTALAVGVTVAILAITLSSFIVVGVAIFFITKKKAEGAYSYYYTVSAIKLIKKELYNNNFCTKFTAKVHFHSNGVDQGAV